jgi:hypothetical protein
MHIQDLILKVLRFFFKKNMVNEHKVKLKV